MSNQYIIIINGTGGAGKDTFVNYCSNYMKVMNISSVDKVKEAANILVGWNGEKDERSRKLLKDLKQLSIEYNNYPTQYILEECNKFKDSENEILFIHIREIEEISKIKDLINAKTLLIKNPRVPLIISNTSDANVYKYEYDYEIENDGTLEDLEQKVVKFLKNVKI